MPQRNYLMLHRHTTVTERDELKMSFLGLLTRCRVFVCVCLYVFTKLSKVALKNLLFKTCKILDLHST